MHRSLGAGGIEAIVCGLSNELVKQNEVTVCTISKPYPTDYYYSRLANEVIKETINEDGNKSAIKNVFKIFRFIKNGKYDIVHLHGFFYFYSLSVILLHNKTKFFYTVHSDALKENNPWDLRLLALKRFCFKKKWLRPITISPSSKESFSEFVE